MRIILLPLLLISMTLFSQQHTTDEILKEARGLASKENKKVFVIFHASWCGWCHKMDTAMNDPVCKKYFDDNYIIRHLTVYESKDKKDLETPGALELLTKYKGNDLGIPYWLIFDADGNLVADSKIRPANAATDTEGNNAGCPATENEVKFFIDVLKQTSSIDNKGLKTIYDRFRQNEIH